MINKTNNKFKPKAIISIWIILLFFSSISLFVFTHESVHAIRYDTTQMMCLGFGDTYGFVMHYDYDKTDEQRFNEEIIANVVGIILFLLYIILTYYMIIHFKEQYGK